MREVSSSNGGFGTFCPVSATDDPAASWPGSQAIAKAKAAGVYTGRKPSVDIAQVRELRLEGLGATQIAKRLGIGRASVYRVLANDIVLEK